MIGLAVCSSINFGMATYCFNSSQAYLLIALFVGVIMAAYLTGRMIRSKKQKVLLVTG